MANSGDGDKFGPLIIPNCLRTASQEENLQSCPFARQSKANIQADSSDDTGIEIVTLPDSSDEYHTPPDHHSCSQNSSNEGQIPPTKTSAFDRNMVGDEDPMPVDDDGETQEQRIVDLTKETNNLGFPDRSHDVVEDNNTGTSARQVFVEMPQREQENVVNREKRKLPFSMKAQKQNSNCYKHEAFTSSLNRVLKMVGEGGSSRGGGQEGIDFLETAKMRGLSLPRPRWWPADGFKDRTTRIRKR